MVRGTFRPGFKSASHPSLTISWLNFLFVVVYSIPIEDMDDSQVALRAARDLTKMPYHNVNPNLHLRLLHGLCNDIVSCQGFKDFMTARIEETYRLQAQKQQADADVSEP